MENKTTAGFAFHYHHDRLWEWVNDFKGRQEDIKANKPSKEVKLILKLFKIIPSDLLPKALHEARDNYDKARDDYNKACAAYAKAWAAYDKAGVAYTKSNTTYGKDIEALHKRLCPDCPWNGYTIFPISQPQT